MPRAKTVVVLIIIALFIVLPLYEVADIGEQWPHDGDVVQIFLCVLLIVGLSILWRGVAGACLASLKRSCLPKPPAPRGEQICPAASRASSVLFLIFCDLRV